MTLCLFVFGFLLPARGQDPSIVTQPADQTVLAGSDATFCVTASGTPPLSYQWRDYPPPGTSFTDIADATNDCLVLTNVQPTTHRFRVVVSAPSGSVTSRLAMLTVQVPPIFTNQPTDQVIDLGENYTNRVVAGGDPTLMYQWHFVADGTTTTNLLAGKTASTLVITNVQFSNEGGYFVVVTNRVGTNTSRFAPLDVITRPPAFVVQPASATVEVGQTYTNWVVASGTMPLSYQWYWGTTPLAGKTASTLSIPNIQLTNAGGYSVVVTNLYGSVPSVVARLKIMPVMFTKITSGVIVTDLEPSLSGNWADYDSDGYPDLFVANTVGSGSTRNTLYHNNGGTNFSRVDASPFTTDFMRAWSAAWADYNNDGNVDLIAANLEGGTLAQRLYRNNGDGSFTAVVDAELQSDTTVATCPWWMDYDNDGFLDLFMAKGSYYSPVANDCLFQNNGDGTFKKMTAAELGPMLNDQLRNNVCSSVDYDNDGYQELSIQHSIPLGGGGEDETNSTWRSQADGTFVATTALGLPNTAVYKSWGDYDNDGRLDAFSALPVPNVGYTPALFRNLGADGFTNVTAGLNVTTPVQVNVVAWGDYDNDGWLDIFFVGAWWNPGFLNGMFHNNRDGTFDQILTGSPVNDGGRPYCPSWTDYDNDGFLDLFIAAGNGDAQRNLLYRNNGNTNHWLKVKLDGRASNRSGIGAKVRLNATIGGTNFWQMREISCENAYGGQNGLLAHFGLGDATNVTPLRIEWPSGHVTEIPNVAANQSLTIQEPPGLKLRWDGMDMHIAITGNIGDRYDLKTSSNVAAPDGEWTPWQTVTHTSRTMTVIDPSPNAPQRFYKAAPAK